MALGRRERDADLSYKGFVIPGEAMQRLAEIFEAEFDALDSIAEGAAEDAAKVILDAIADRHAPQSPADCGRSEPLKE
jgi:hypothetical protein